MLFCLVDMSTTKSHFYLVPIEGDLGQCQLFGFSETIGNGWRKIPFFKTSDSKP